MKVRVLRIADDFQLNVRYTDELLEDGTFRDEAELQSAEFCLKEVGRYYVSGEIYLKPL